MPESYSFIAIADVHLGAKLYNIPELEADLREIFVRICDEAIARKVTYLLIAGDLFDSNKPTPDLIAFVRHQVARLRKAGITVTGIAGDHDKLLNGETWVSVCNIVPLSEVPVFAGVDFNDRPDSFFEHFRQRQNKEQVQWLVAHGQETSMFAFVQEKKRLDFTKFPLFSEYPNLRGVILGDIHSPLEAELVEGDRVAYIGYCGSPGYVKSDEYGTKKGVLYFDGQNLQRLPIFPEREFKTIEFVGTAADPMFVISEMTEAARKCKVKPIIIIKHDKTTKERLKELAPLYAVGYVRTSLQVSPGEQRKPQVNIRAEIADESRYDEVLKEMLDGELRTLAGSLLSTTDPKGVLDAFRTKTFAPESNSSTTSKP